MCKQTRAELCKGKFNYKKERLKAETTFPYL